jgi:hypothetical protein
MIWERTENKNSLRSGEFVIIKWLMPDQKYIYCLWHHDMFVGRFNSSREAKEHAARSQ